MLIFLMSYGLLRLADQRPVLSGVSSSAKARGIGTL